MFTERFARVMPLSHYSLECLGGDVEWGVPGGFFVSKFVFRCFSVFRPLWLVLFHTVNVSVFSGVLFWHCFCSLCCDLCAATWVTEDTTQ